MSTSSASPARCVDRSCVRPPSCCAAGLLALASFRADLRVSMSVSSLWPYGPVTPAFPFPARRGALPRPQLSAFVRTVFRKDDHDEDVGDRRICRRRGHRGFRGATCRRRTRCGAHRGRRSHPTDEAVDFVRRSLLEHRVVFLRAQRLDYDSQVAFAQRFGALTLGHPTIPSLPANRCSKKSTPGRAVPPTWHTDVTFVYRPPAFTFLHGVVIPPVGGDTIWANTVAAYRNLPLELQERPTGCGSCTRSARLRRSSLPRRGTGSVARRQPQAVRVHRLQDRASCGAYTPGDR